MERIYGRYWRPVKVLGVAMLVVAGVATPVLANAADVGPLVPFLLKSGEMPGVEPGKAQVFQTVGAVRAASGEKPSERETKRYEDEGFVEAAIVRIHDRAEPAAKGISSALEFETPPAAKAEMYAEWKEEFDPATFRRKGFSRYLDLRRFKVPGVPGVVAYAIVPNKASEELGAESAIAKALLVKGSCLFSLGIFRPGSDEVIEPVIQGIQAVSGRTGDICA